jgi:enoyl-CoA hydratase/carnithine racemase
VDQSSAVIVSEYPLSATDLQHLMWFRLRMEAKEHLALTQQTVTGMEAKRLAFASYLVTTNRLTEHSVRETVQSSAGPWSFA